VLRHENNSFDIRWGFKRFARIYSELNWPEVALYNVVVNDILWQCRFKNLRQGGLWTE